VRGGVGVDEGAQHRRRLLGGGGVVQVRQRIAVRGGVQDREVRPDGTAEAVEARGGRGCHADSSSKLSRNRSTKSGGHVYTFCSAYGRRAGGTHPGSPRRGSPPLAVRRCAP